MEGFGSQSAIGRPGQPSEIAPTYVFLASAEAELYCKSIDALHWHELELLVGQLALFQANQNRVPF